jgi:taurine dioxygenase
MTFMAPQAEIRPPIGLRRLTGALGAEISGVDLSAPLPSSQMAAIRQAFLDHSVLIFRDQALSPGALADLGRQFGELEEEPFIPKLEGHPGVYQLTGAGGARLSTQNLHWHADHTYREIPSLGTILYGVSVPEVGGDTVFANMYLAYEGLSDTLRPIVDNLVVIHDVLQYGITSGHLSSNKPEALDRLVKMRTRFPAVEHPMVCTHPETGRKFLFINPAWTIGIKGMTTAESRPLLDMLNAHATQPKYQCRVRWDNGTAVMWDNRCLQHAAIADYAGPRHMYRVAIAGTWRPS